MDTLSHKEADKGAIVSIMVYIFLSSMKIIISYITLSSALRADGLNNLTDIGASLAILIGLKISRKPRDPDHPYGHSRVRTNRITCCVLHYGNSRIRSCY